MPALPPDRLSRLVWSILEQSPDTFVVGSKVGMDAGDMLVVKAYVERMEILAGFIKARTVEDDLRDIIDEKGES